MAEVYSPLLLSLALFLQLSVECIGAKVKWPEGSYGLPKAMTGCPLSPETKWTTGWRFEDTEDSRPNNFKSSSYHLDTVVGLDVNRTFCMKVDNDETTEWPKGQYCIYKKADCPKGFQEGYVYWDDEDYKNVNKKGGTLPDGVYDRDTLIKYCCRADGDKLTPVTLPVMSSFYLMMSNTSECQRVKGAVATKEFIRFDNEDTNNKDRQNGSYPYGAGIKNHKLYYCYYESCNFTYSLDSEGEIQFTSPNYFKDGFPRAQTCSWRFVVPETKRARIRFLDVGLEGDDSITLVEGWGPTEGSRIGDIKSTSRRPHSYSASLGSPMLVTFHSTSRPQRLQSKGFRGIFTAQTEPPSSLPEWPSGTFGLPRSKFGCPYSKEITWSSGWRYQDTEDDHASNQKSHSFHMDAVVNKSAVNRSFCMATENKGNGDWPKGQYCIYKKGVCPKGLSEGYLFFDDENHKNQNRMGGTLPDGVYDQDTKLFYCCRTDGDKRMPMSLPLVSPFYLMAFNSSECQRVKGAMVTQEYIQFDDEDESNKDSSSGMHPYEKGKLNVTISYCYYEACHFTLGENSQEFSSPNYRSTGYSNSQICSWRFHVKDVTPPKQQILLKFPEFRLRKGKDGDVIKIYSGWDASDTLLAEFNGDNPPPIEGVASATSVVYLVFISDEHGQSQGFRGLFLNQEFNSSAVYKQPITSPRGTKDTATQASAVTTKPATTSVPATVHKSSTIEPSTTLPSAVHRKLASTQSSSSSAKVVIPLVIIALILVAVVTVYCVRRRRREKRFKKRLDQSRRELVNNGTTYRDLNSKEYESYEDFQEIFPQG